MTTAPVDFASTSHFAITNGMRLHYHDAGADGAEEGPPVVMLHGGGPGAAGGEATARPPEDQTGITTQDGPRG